jgi:hypothetical protein
MIAYWMLYCTAVGTLAGCGALAMERALRPLGRATRWAWAGGMLLTIAIPAAVRFVPAFRAAPAAADGRQAPSDGATSLSLLPRKEAAAWNAARLDGPLSVACGASSAAVALALAGMGLALRRRRREWASAEVDGVSVLVSCDTGPAVVGLLHSRIVLPRWAVDGDGEARRLVLEHEREHIRAGDPRLLAACLAAAVLMPWNPAVWWQLRRLRLAVEVDCDARVLRRRGDVRAYGSVLLEVGRRTVHSRLAAAAFAEPVSTLERRIRIMTAPRARRPLLRAAGFGALAAILAAAACAAPAPAGPAPSARGEYRKTELTPQTAVATYFPEVLHREMPANEVLLFVVSPERGVVRHERIPSANLSSATAGISADQIDAVNVLKRPAGEIGPGIVSIVWVQLKPTAAAGR